MKITNNNRVMMILLAALLMVSLVACGTKDTMTPVVEETSPVAPVATEEPTEEVDTNATYAEVNELKYEENTKVTTKGTLYVGDDIGTLKVIDVDWEITNITISDAENGVKNVVIESESRGYIWWDETGNIFASNLNVPTARLCDIYTGKMISANEDAESIEIEWKGETYTISAMEAVSWEDGDWNTDWVEDPDGGERLSSTLKVKTVVNIDEDYDGLALVLTPITDANGSGDGEYIMDVWADGSYLFHVNDLSAKFVADVEVDGEEEEEVEVDESMEVNADSTPEPVDSTPKPTETSQKPAESTPTPTEQPVHVHSYTSTDTPSTCTVPGTRTYTCSCGSSYSESLGLADHNYVASTTTIHHDEQYEAVKREIPGYKVIICRECKGEFYTQADWDNHILGCSIWACEDIVEYPATTTYDYVKVADAWDEQITVYKCSVCGKQQ